VDGAHDVVEGVCVEQLRGAILRTADVVRLHTEPQRGGLDELAVAGQVVLGLVVPVGMAPELDGLLEAVDVLRDAQLLDPLLLRGGEVAVDVLLGEVAVGRPDLVGAQMQVVVGEHGTNATRASL
jgi:hypothetical protein